ncbi:MAG TPA: menaquinol-cytochrome c reductase cytochrome b subunit [Actinomycetota bacterium]|nr:menaquinol-cytochrome c reductase cytochrome b subunit [Actinomycetota bacterium]
MSEEVGIDQETFDKAIAEGKPERVARALAKSAWVRKNRGPASAAPAPAAPAPPGDGDGAEAPAAAAPAAPAAQAPAAAAPAAATATVPRLTPEERAARVAAATGTKVNGGGGRGTGAGETHRLLAFVPPDGIQRVEKRQEDKINVWPHLLAEEFLSLVIVLAGLILFSSFVNAPSRELANPFLTPNPSKAPWYFLGLQELLRYFHPMVAGVTLPGLGLFGLMAVPYVDKNPSMKPERRKLAIMLFTVFVLFWSVLTMIGVFFRGPGFNWIWPWQTGLFVDL